MLISGQYYPQFKSESPLKDTMANGAAVVTKPIEHVEKIVNNTVDTFVPESKNEETKKSHKTAIKVVSTVLVLSAIIPFLNPKFSSKLIDKLKTASAKYGAKGKSSDSLMGKIYKAGENIFSKGAKVLNFTNNYNSVKDEFFKWICKKTKILQKPHEWITKGFDSVSKHTVFNKYKKVQKNINLLNETIKQYKTNLPKSDADKIEKLLQKAANQREYFSEKEIAKRLQEQENLMSNLEKDTVAKIKNYGLKYKEAGRVKHFKDNLYFWAEDIIKPQKEKIQSRGAKAIQEIAGSETGTYDQIMEILKPHLKENEKTGLEELFKSTVKKINSANKTECTEYFDKKRDLMLGSAPTDVLSALIGLGASGIAIGSADNKEDRISRSVTVAFPAIAGLGVSMGMTAMLYSGIKGMLIGAASSGVLSLTGSTIDKNLIRKNKPKEALNA